MSAKDCCCSSKTEVKEENNNNCPICDNEGKSVGKETTEHLVKDGYSNLLHSEQYVICMNEDCDVVYYNFNKDEVYFQNQVKVPVWFKADANPKYACYCSEVTDTQVINAIKEQGAKTVKEINAITGAMKDSNCIKNNPLGTCCHGIIQDIMDKTLV